MIGAADTATLGVCEETEAFAGLVEAQLLRTTHLRRPLSIPFSLLKEKGTSFGWLQKRGRLVSR